MTCFWDAIWSSLCVDDYTYLKIQKTSRNGLIASLKKLKKPVDSVSWQGSKLKKQEKEEHLEAINVYNSTNINNGHLTSTCDSFLLLLSELFKLNITHNYCGHVIQYTCENPRKTLKFTSNRGHFKRG